MNTETNDNDFKGVFGNRKLENSLKLNVLVTCSSCCGHEMLQEHVITEASLMTGGIKLHSMLILVYELDVFSIAEKGEALSPKLKTSSPGGFSEGLCPLAKID